MAEINKLFLILSLFLISLACVTAIQPQQSYSKIFATPYYRPSMSLNTNYSYTFQVNPPDGISNVLSAIIAMDIYQTPTITYSMSVNGVPCRTPTFSVSTTFAGAGQGRITFDCGNIITNAGNYNVNLRVTQANTGASTMWLDLTYMNNPRGEVKLHGTEYNNEQTAKVWLQLLNSSQQAITSAVCYVDIYTPSNEEYLEHATMTNMGHDGIYYYDLQVPLLEGVYPVIANCFYTAIETPNYPSTITMINGTLDSGSVTNVIVQDSSYLLTTEHSSAFGNPRRYESQFKFLNATCNNISSSLLTGITTSWVGRWNSNVVNDVITISIYNYTSGKWLPMPNTITGSGTGVKSVSNSISFNNITKAGLVNSSGKGLMLKFNDTYLADATSTGLDYDYLSLYCDQLGDPQYQQVKGSSEIHVTRTPEQKTFQATTLCGNELTSCAEFKNNPDYWNYTWGYIEENLTFVNIQQSTIDDYYDYETPLGEDCSALIDIVKSNSTGSVSILDDVILNGGNKENCVISIPVQFQPTDYSFNVVVTLDNYMRWEVQRDKDYVNYFELVIVPFCQDVADASGSSYNIPMEVDGEQDISTLYADRPLFLGCYRALDDLYWFENYYNASLNITTSGEFESYLLEARYYYPEIRSHAQIFQSISKDIVNTLFNVETLCGNAVETTCAIAYPPDDYFSSQEGYIVENLSITNIFNTQLVADYRYVTSPDIDCSAILEILLYHENGSVSDIYNDAILSLGTDKNCVMNIPISFDINEHTSNIIIKMENYVHWNMYQMNDKVKSIRANTEDICNEIADLTNTTYNLPINESIDQYLNDLNVMFCYRAMDDLYWWDFFEAIHIEDTQNHTLAVPIGTIESTYAEQLYFYPFIMENDRIVTAYLASPNQRVTLGLLYELISNTSQKVWSYQNRTLTQNISASVNVNTTQIANDIWNWNGLINSNILNQTANAIWSFVGRYIQGEII
jgi:hypothetical protein